MQNNHFLEKVVDGIHFVWVYQNSYPDMPSHWVSMGGNRVHVVEIPPQEQLLAPTFDVFIHYQSTFHPTLNNFRAHNNYANEEEAFRKAAHWAKRRMSRIRTRELSEEDEQK